LNSVLPLLVSAISSFLVLFLTGYQGRAKLWVDKVEIIDNWTKQTPGDFFYGCVL